MIKIKKKLIKKRVKLKRMNIVKNKIIKIMRKKMEGTMMIIKKKHLIIFKKDSQIK